MKRMFIVALALCLCQRSAVTVLAQNPQRQPGPPPAAAQAPFPPLTPEYQKYLEDVLRYWEQRSKAVERYRCAFKRWEYDPVFGPPNTFKTYSEGVIKYAAADKGLFKVEKILHYTPPREPGQPPTYVPREGEVFEHWICDGKSVFEYDQKNRQLKQMELPPEMRGRAIAEGPLPFLFQAEAEKIKHQYWIRPLDVPKEAQAEIWLEAFPKTRKGAANFQKVQVIIDRQDFLPKGFVIFDRNFDAQRNPARTTFTFDKREVNWSVGLAGLNPFLREFWEPNVPLGWKKVIEKYEAPPEGESANPAGAAATTQSARLPAGDLRR
jgi:TIGR03009 family protein